MDAWAADSAGATVRRQFIDLPSLAAGDVEIDVSACGLCRSDLHLIDDDWRMSRFPLVPGHEVAGLVVAAGPNAEVRVGERVGFGWLCGACFDCEACRTGLDNLCRSKVATTGGRAGGFAPRLRADARFAIPIPAAISDAEAAPLLCAGVSVYAPLARLGGRRVAVVGIGGLGHLALQYARALGMAATAISSRPDKRDEAIEFGAADFALTDAASLKALRGRFDLVLVSSESEQDWSALMRTLRPRGTLCLLTTPDTPLAFPPGLLMVAESSVTASSYGSREVARQALRIAAEHGVRPKIERFEWDRAPEAVARLREGARYRVVLTREVL